jgi:hypothetical protein
VPEASVVPVLIYPDVPAAVIWLTEAFGFSVRVRVGERQWTFTETLADVAPEDWGGTTVEM